MHFTRLPDGEHFVFNLNILDKTPKKTPAITKKKPRSEKKPRPHRSIAARTACYKERYKPDRLQG